MRKEWWYSMWGINENKSRLKNCIVQTGYLTIDIAEIACMVNHRDDMNGSAVKDKFDIHMKSGTIFTTVVKGQFIYEEWLEYIIEAE